MRLCSGEYLELLGLNSDLATTECESGNKVMECPPQHGTALSRNK